MDTNLSIWSFSVTPNNSFIPRRSPKPSSPTSATKVSVPGVRIGGFFQGLNDGQQRTQSPAIVADAGAL